MMFEDRPYQTRTIEHFRQRINSRVQFRSCVESPTGSGKTVIMARLMLDPWRQTLATHRRFLLDQIAEELDTAGVGYGFIAPGKKANPGAPIQLAMTQTLLKRGERNPQFFESDVLHIDEIHCQRGEKYCEMFSRFYSNGASVIGYSATPSDLSGMVDDVYRAATVPELISQGYLCPPRVFGCGQPDIRRLEQLRRDAQGEYLAGDVNKLVKPQIIFGRVVQEYKRLNPDGRPFVLFAHSVKASIWWAQTLTAKGIPTAHIDGDDVWLEGKFYKSDTETRQRCFDWVTTGRLQGISNRFVLREGWNCPAIGHAIMTAPVGSRKVWVQMCGRVLRPYPNREYSIVQDHGGGSGVHPALDSAEPWDWESPPGLAEKIRIGGFRDNAPANIADADPDKPHEPITCPKCMGVRYAGDTCPYCGFRYPKHCRYVIQTDGTLRLIEGRAFEPRKVRPRPGDDKLVEKLYWRTVKNGNRTAEQAYSYFAYSNNWRWLDRRLPFFPKDQADWYIPWRLVPPARLHAARRLAA